MSSLEMIFKFSFTELNSLDKMSRRYQWKFSGHWVCITMEREAKAQWYTVLWASLTEGFVPSNLIKLLSGPFRNGSVIFTMIEMHLYQILPDNWQNIYWDFRNSSSDYGRILKMSNTVVVFFFLPGTRVSNAMKFEKGHAAKNYI